MSLTKEQMLNHLRNTDPLNEIPFRPKGGETFLFQGGSSKLQDWRADGHRCINQASSKRVLTYRALHKHANTALI